MQPQQRPKPHSYQANALANFVAPGQAPSAPVPLSPVEGEIIARGSQFAGQLMTTRSPSADIQTHDSALTHAKASLLYSVAYSAPAAMITAGLLLVIWMYRGGPGGVYFFVGLIVWGMAFLAALYGNRAQGLHHSATGVAHHEIDAKTEVAIYAIDRHCQMLEAKWMADRGKS